MLVALPASIMITLRALAGSFGEVVRDPATRGIGLVAIGAVAVATLFFAWVEGWGLLDSLYFSVISLATVGYGDLAPATPLGRIGAIVMVVFGVGIVATFFGSIARRAGDRAQHRATVVRDRFARRTSKAGEDAKGVDDALATQHGAEDDPANDRR
jgi:voltage-gated potassium channel